MSEKCIIVNRCFSDEFDLPLCEGVIDDSYTVGEIKQEVEKRIIKLAALSTEYKLSPESIIEYEIGNLRNPKAVAEIEPVATHKYVFRISKSAARKCYENYFDTIIYHELCHALQVDLLISAHIIYFEEGELCYEIDQKELVKLLYEADDGHTKLWYSFVRIANAALVISPPVDRFFNVNLDVSDAFLESTFRRDKVVIHNRAFSDDFGWLLEEEPD
jgi:hypothetical protein